MKNAWIVEGGGDGDPIDSRVVIGDKEDVINVLLDVLYIGPKEEALKDEGTAAIIEDFRDEDNWNMYGIWYCDLEQAYVRVAPITNTDSIKELL